MTRRGDSAGRGRLERFLFSFMGPPQLGDINAPARDLPVRLTELCTRCGRSYDLHEVVRDPGLTYSRCPEAPGGATIRA